MLSDIFGTGRTSRLYKSLVQKKRVGVSIWAGSTTPGERDACLFVFGGAPRSPHTAKDLEEEITEEIAKIQKDGISDKELEKVKNLSIDYIVRALSSNGGLSRHLGYYEALAGDWAFLLKLIDDIQSVTTEDVQRVAKKYLVKSNRTVATLVKKENHGK